VLTRPDRPAGRGKKLTQSAVKRLALEEGLTVRQPATLRDDAEVAALAALEPDVLVVAAYGLLLPQAVLDVPAAGCVNVHASLLPRWRGASPIQTAILAGDRETGVCLMQMTAGLDAGAVYACEATPIAETDTAGELGERLAAIGGRLLVRHLDAIAAGDLEPRPQEEALVTHAPKVRNADARLDWQQPADVLARAVRAYNPAPGAWFMLDNERIKCWSASPMAEGGGPAGTVIGAAAVGVVVACGKGALRLVSLQRPGRRPVTAREFAAQVDLAGRRL